MDTRAFVVIFKLKAVIHASFSYFFILSRIRSRHFVNTESMSGASKTSQLTLIELLAQFLNQCHLQESSALLLEEAGRLEYPWLKLSPSTAKTIHDALISNCLDDIASAESGSFRTDDDDGADETESDAHDEDASSDGADGGQQRDDNPKLWGTAAPVPWSAAVDAVDSEAQQNSTVDISALSDEYDDDNDCG